MTIFPSFSGLILGVLLHTIPWYPFVRHQFPQINQKIFLYSINLLFAICSTAIISHFSLLLNIFSWQFVAVLNLLFALLFFYLFKECKPWAIYETQLDGSWRKWALGVSLISVLTRVVEIIVNSTPKSFDTFIHYRIISRILEYSRPLESSLFYPLGMHGWIVSWSTYGDWREILLLSPLIGAILWSVFSWFLVCRFNLPDFQKVFLITLLNFTPFNPIAQHLAWSELPIPRIFVYSIFFFLLSLALLPREKRGSIISPAILVCGTILIHNLSSLNFVLFLFVYLLSNICRESFNDKRTQIDMTEFFSKVKLDAKFVILIFLTPLIVGAIALHANSTEFNPEIKEPIQDVESLSIDILSGQPFPLIEGNRKHFELDLSSDWSQINTSTRVGVDLNLSESGRSNHFSELTILCGGSHELEIGAGKSSYSGIVDIQCVIIGVSQNTSLTFSTIPYDDTYDAEGLPPHSTLGLIEPYSIDLEEDSDDIILIPIVAKSLPPDGSWTLRLDWGFGETNITIKTGSYNSDVISDISPLEMVFGFISFKPNKDFLEDNLWWIVILSLMLIYTAFIANTDSRIKSIAISGIMMNFCLISGWLSYPADWGVVRLAHMQVIPMALAITICGWDIYDIFSRTFSSAPQNKNVLSIIFIIGMVIFGGHTSYQAELSKQAWNGALSADSGDYYVSNNAGWLNYANPQEVEFLSSDTLTDNWGEAGGTRIDERCFPNNINLFLESSENSNLKEWAHDSSLKFPERWSVDDAGDGFEYWYFQTSSTDGVINISYDGEVKISWLNHLQISDVMLIGYGSSYESAVYFNQQMFIRYPELNNLYSEFRYWFCAPNEGVISPIFSYV